MRFRNLSFASTMLSLALSSALAQNQTATLNIDAGKAKAKSSPEFYGLMTEEINYSYDGGLYGELVRDRVVKPGFGGLQHWTLVQRGLAKATVSIDMMTGPSAAIPDSMKIEVASADQNGVAGVENDGYWGIPLRPRTSYKGSFWGKADKARTAVTVSLISDDTGKTLVKKTVPEVGTDWKQYEFTLETPEMTASSRNHLVLTVAQPGTLWLNLVSLFPPTYKARKNGNREDIMELLAAMHPHFLRFPGGNYLEGNKLADWYNWKKTIGPLVDRPTHPSPWGYRSSDGLGLLEFLEWCEDLDMQPVLAVYAGYALQGEHIAPGPKLAPYVQDALDEIEYATGDTSTKWGAVRAKDGHPKPFHLNFIEIGNEDWFDKSGSYDGAHGRYAQFYDSIKKKYPKLQLIATTPVKAHVYDVIDEHYYKTAKEFFSDTHRYDNADRKGPKIFVGEWATREGVPTPNFGAALGDAAWMTGMERNSDIVIMESYAPLLTNVNPGGLQWDTDLIGYNAMESYGSPSYYAQVLFSQHHGDEILSSSFAKADNAQPTRLYQSVTRDGKSGMLYIKLVNANTVAASVTLNLKGAAKIGASGHEYTLSAPSTEDTNSITAPKQIVPAEHELGQLGDRFQVTLAPLSINVLEVPTGGSSGLSDNDAK